MQVRVHQFTCITSVKLHKKHMVWVEEVNLSCREYLWQTGRPSSSDMWRIDLPEQQTTLTQERRRAPLLDKALAMFPPKLHRWFLARFGEASQWHAARLRFARTSAVWSMVGHIAGLGDRHGENILIDAASGDAVHVDFSCLFDKVCIALPFGACVMCT